MAENSKPGAFEGPQVLLELQKRVQQAEASRLDAAKTTRYVLWGMGGMVVVTAVGIGVLMTRFPLERFVYTDNAKQMCEAQLETTPLVTTNTVTEFAKDCALDMDTFAHDSVERDLDRMASRCLTPGFRKKFFEAPWLADRISTVRGGLLRVNSQTTGPVLVMNSGPTADGYLWRVQVPVKRNYTQGDTPKGSNERVYVMDVFRVVRDAYNPVGLGVNAIAERSATR